MTQTFELQLTGMAYGGEAFGRDESGRMVFVPFALPGERVLVRTVEEHKRWARAFPEKVLVGSELRIDPRCKHFGLCGGCHYQHIPYDEQLRFKREIVIDQLQRIGGFAEPPVVDCVPSPSTWQYRNRMRFHRSQDGELGFYDHAGSEIFVVEECHLPQKNLEVLWPEVDIEALETVKQVGLRDGSQGPAMIVLHASGKPDIEALVQLPASMVWSSEAGNFVLAGDDHITIEVSQRDFRVSPGSFFQVNTAMITELVAHVMDLLDPIAGEHILDLYAGVGLFSRFLAEKEVVLLGIEQSMSACADYLVNLEGYETVELWAASVEEGLASVELEPDAALLDPPRAGVSNQAFDELMRLAPDRIVYVSCDPATLARDAKKLEAAGYQLRSVTPFDMFPQTYHIETVSLWIAL
ncbi:MAG: class I SAM-dependent RNA methyltransferase [Anaerolineales bacterium]|jgi:23S rRNA (uracil1939-C5)-methyltransferase